MSVSEPYNFNHFVLVRKERRESLQGYTPLNSGRCGPLIRELARVTLLINNGADNTTFITLFHLARRTKEEKVHVVSGLYYMKTQEAIWFSLCISSL